MAYKKIKSYDFTEDELREMWVKTYCDPKIKIITFDGVLVKFYEDMFDHAFKESDNWKKKDKSILSLNRCEKMLWIKDTLMDSEAILKQGWDKSTKSYDDSRRVALVKGNYIVVIRFTSVKRAKFVTAYEINDSENLKKIMDGPDWTGADTWL